MALSGALPHPHTLAQLARRAGISEGRARALYTAGKLPRPDQVDADERPLWSAVTIDAWCRQTGRPLGDKVSWLHRAAPAAEPAPVLFHGIVEHKRGYGALTVHAIVWDTPGGHVIYLTPVFDEQGNGGGDHADRIAEAAAELVRPVFWDQALIVQPVTVDLGSGLNIPTVHLNLHRLEAQQPESAADDAGGGWLRRRKANLPPGKPEVRARFHGMVKAGLVAAVTGVPVPLWLWGTCTRAAVKRAEAYNATFTVPDVVTDWPAARDQVQAALDAGMPDRFPAAFAALAAGARSTFEEVQALQARQRDSGDGWYLVARPAPPELPFTSEMAIATAQPSDDVDAVALELTELRGVEADLSVDAPEGDAYETAVKLLAWQLERSPEVPTTRIEIYGDTYSGPVIDQWRHALQPVPDPKTALKTRRVRRLLRDWDLSNVVEVLRGPGDRYVLLTRNEHGHPYFAAEWPYALPLGWNERTIIAADPDSSGAVFALTPTASGDMNVDPLPLEPGTGPSFAYGYDGGSPYTLYQALIRCVFGTPEAPFTLPDVTDVTEADPDRSALWHAIVTTEGPLRLPWPTVQGWARADAAKAGYTGHV